MPSRLAGGNSSHPPSPSPPPESGSAKMKSDPQRTEWRVGTGQGAQHHSVNGFLLSHVQNVATRAAVHTWSVFTWAVEVCDWRDSANTMVHLQTYTYIYRPTNIDTHTQTEKQGLASFKVCLELRLIKRFLWVFSVVGENLILAICKSPLKSYRQPSTNSLINK